MPLAHDDMLRLITERSERLHDAVVTADDLDARVPSCPEWTLADLVVHVGQVQRSWAEKVQAGVPQDGAETPPVDDTPGESATKQALLEWFGESTSLLTDALRRSGPSAPCWTWWEASDAPSDSGAVARHQIQEAAVHAYDAQSTVGHPEPLPVDVAVDGVEEFLVVSFGALGPWPYPDARVAFTATDGPTWTLRMTPAGAKLLAVGANPDGATATVTGSASDLLLALYSRIPLDAIGVDGDRPAVEQLFGWVSVAL